MWDGLFQVGVGVTATVLFSDQDDVVEMVEEVGTPEPVLSEKAGTEKKLGEELEA